MTDGANRTAIGRYTVLNKLGSGGQADVYRGLHPTLPIEVAIKIAHGEVDEGAREALKQEAYALCDLDHPNIARVRDFDFWLGRPFIVLDFLRERSLEQVAVAHPHTAIEASELVRQLALAMDHAHQRGIVHRDLKPENVVMSENGVPKIIDFGMSRIRSALTGTETPPNEVSGTLLYMAPEQAIGIMSNTDHRVDVFALGAILYRLLVGKPPYTPESLQGLLAKVRKGEWDQRALEASAVPQPLQAIVCKALAVDPKDRYQSAGDLANVLQQWIKEQQTSLSRKKPILMGAAVCLISICLTGVLYQTFLRTASIQPERHEVTPQTDGTEASLVQAFEVIHIGNEKNKAAFSGSLFQFRPPRENDDLQVRAKFTKPSYCFLIALNPNGTRQLCYPADEEQVQPMPISVLRFPNEEDTVFGLTDGAGPQAFVLYVSSEPLPAFYDWELPWSDSLWQRPELTGNWSYADGELASLLRPMKDQDRGTIRNAKVPTPFKQFCDELRVAKQGEVRGVLFEVLPQ